MSNKSRLYGLMTSEELVDARNELDLSQAQLARRVGDYHTNTVWKWENGVSPIPALVALVVRLMRDNASVRDAVEEDIKHAARKR